MTGCPIADISCATDLDGCIAAVEEEELNMLCAEQGTCMECWVADDSCGW